MRMMLLAAVGAAALVAGVANAQSPSPGQNPASPPATSPQAPKAAPAIKSVNVVELSELPEATKTQVNELVAKRTAEDNQRLQRAIEGAPMVKTAVEAKGFSSRDVLVAQLNDEGELIVITKRAG
ncbi:hypothetical protein [Bosea thiooxidans]